MSEPVAAQTDPMPSDDLLVSQATASAATASLASIYSAVGSDSQDAGMRIGSGRTLEEVVREALAPELKAWLDANLAQLVERIVREEVKKMIRRAEDL